MTFVNEILTMGDVIMRLKLLLILMFLFSTTAPCFAKDGTGYINKKEIIRYCKSVLVNLVEDKIPDAFDLIENEWPFPASEIESSKVQTVKQLELVKPRFGKLLNYKLIKIEEIKDLCLRYTYVIKYERHITRWMFIFYKPKDKWILNDFKWDDSINDLF